MNIDALSVLILDGVDNARWKLREIGAVSVVRKKDIVTDAFCPRRSEPGAASPLTRTMSSNVNLLIFPLVGAGMGNKVER